jgi:hypothetical protein
MGASTRVSRGFHRLALFLAAMPLLLGAVISFYAALDAAGNAAISHDEQVQLFCARTPLLNDDAVARQAAAQFQSKFEEHGYSTMPNEVTSCYSQARDLKQEKVLAFCVMFDVIASTVSTGAHEKFGDQLVNSGFFEQTNMSSRLQSIFDLLGYDQQTRNEKINAWDKLATKALSHLTSRLQQSNQPLPVIATPLNGVDIDLGVLGCSKLSRTVTYQEVLDASEPGGFHYWRVFASYLSVGLAITLAVTLAVYGIVRVIGWVIGGFAAS